MRGQDLNTGGCQKRNEKKKRELAIALDQNCNVMRIFFCQLSKLLPARMKRQMIARRLS